MEMILITPESIEWNFMWNWLANHPINKDNEEPTVCLNNTQSWQYMGSYKNGKKVITEFRHRIHPITNRVERLSVEHKDFDEDSILKTIKI